MEIAQSIFDILDTIKFIATAVGAISGFIIGWFSGAKKQKKAEKQALKDLVEKEIIEELQNQQFINMQEDGIPFSKKIEPSELPKEEQK